MRRHTRLLLFGLILLGLAIAVAVSVRRTAQQERIWKTELLTRNPAYLHSERMQVAAAQAAMDALAMATTQSSTLYQLDYRQQRMQLQANWMGLEQLAAQDSHRQALLLEIRASLAALLADLDRTTTSITPPTAQDQSRLLADLHRAQNAMADYSGSLAQGTEKSIMQPLAPWFDSVWLSLILLLLAGAALMIVLEYCLRKNEKQSPQDRLQSQILDSTDTMVLTCDAQGKVLHANPAAMRMLGWQAQIPLDTNLPNVLAPGEYVRLAQLPTASSLHAAAAQGLSGNQAGDGPILLTELFRANGGSSMRDVELQFQRQDGSRFWALCSFSPLRNTALKVEGLVCTATDISTRHDAEIALRESEKRYRNLCEHTQEMMAILDNLGRYQYVNTAWLSYMDKTSEQVIGASFESVFPMEQQAAAAALLRKVTHGQPVDRRILKMRKQDGAEAELEVMLAFKPQNGMPQTVQVAFRDVTESNRRERHLAIQGDIGRILAKAVSIDVLLPELLQVFAAHLNADFADLWLVQEHPARLHCASQYSRAQRQDGSLFRSTVQDTLAEGEEIPGRILTRKAALWIEDVSSEQELQGRQKLMAEGIISAWGVPIRADNQLLATLQFYHRRKRRPDFELVYSVEQMCAFFGQYLVRSAEQTEMQRILHQSNSVLRSVSDGIFAYDVEGRIIFANPSAARFFDLPPSLLLGRSLHVTVHPEADEPCDGNCPIHHALQQADAITDEDVFRRADGSAVPVRFSLAPLTEQGVHAGGVLCFQPNLHTQAANGSLFASMAEEFRAPLERMLGNLSLLSSHMAKIDPSTAEATESALANASHLLQLANTCIELEQIQSGHFTEAPELCDLTSLAQEAIDSLQPLVSAANVHLQLTAQPVTMPVVAPQILEVFLHVLNRAIHVSPPGSTIAIIFDDTPEELHIYIKDNGYDVDAEALERNLAGGLFTDKSGNESAGSSSVALALCRVIMRQHGGRIWAERTADQGLTIHLRFPHS
ncbi:MAG TPA: PAS domain S-box protein [Acidobacteriaceae bacterium]|jgi:PAS domain S-box-containing protein|nr:PAS domain S-box protein [Acidobacteriaceae bacterium]